MHILKKTFDYVVGALGIVAGSLIIYAGVRAIVRGEFRLLTPGTLSLCVLAVVAAYVKLRQKYKGEK
jgi:drug/metabolite transporter superfamily protein YnfA